VVGAERRQRRRPLEHDPSRLQRRRRRWRVTAPYSKVARDLWLDDAFRALGLPAQRLWLRLITGPELVPLAGLLLHTGPAALAESLEVESVAGELAELEALGWVKVDRPRQLVWLPGVTVDPLQWPANQNVVTSWRSIWARLGSSPLRREIFEALAAVCAAKGEAFEEALWVACPPDPAWGVRRREDQGRATPARAAQGGARSSGTKGAGAAQGGAKATGRTEVDVVGKETTGGDTPCELPVDNSSFGEGKNRFGNQETRPKKKERSEREVGGGSRGGGSAPGRAEPGEPRPAAVVFPTTAGEWTLPDPLRLELEQLAESRGIDLTATLAKARDYVRGSPRRKGKMSSFVRGWVERERPSSRTAAKPKTRPWICECGARASVERDGGRWCSPCLGERMRR